MVRMIRKQVLLNARQDALIKRRARELNMSQADVLRERVDGLAMEEAAPRLDRKAWLRERKFMMTRVGLASASARRTWTREELYDERLRRVPR
jgi:hypothetical protein